MYIVVHVLRHVVLRAHSFKFGLLHFFSCRDLILYRYSYDNVSDYKYHSWGIKIKKTERLYIEARTLSSELDFLKIKNNIYFYCRNNNDPLCRQIQF
jgi:hypothetical protein